MISWWNKRFSANNLILLTSAFGLGHKILLPQFTTFTGNNDLFLSALRASRNKRIIFCFKSFISSLDHYDLRIIIIKPPGPKNSFSHKRNKPKYCQICNGDMYLWDLINITLWKCYRIIQWWKYDYELICIFWKDT